MDCKKRDQKTLSKRIGKFIRLDKEKHGINHYDYSLAREEYSNNRTPVHLKCNKCENPPFKVYPFAHTNKGENEKGTCPHCYIPKLSVQEMRWDKNIKVRAEEFNNIITTFLAKLEMKYIAREKPHYNVIPGSELGAYRMNIDTNSL